MANYLEVYAVWKYIVFFLTITVINALPSKINRKLSSTILKCYDCESWSYVFKSFLIV